MIGISAFTDRLVEDTKSKKSNKSEKIGDFFQVDRQGFPVINVVLIDYARKRDYNRATPVDDANLMFAAEIVNRLQELGTNASNIGILANAVVLNGDQLRLDTSIPNPGSQGGNAPNTGFLNPGGGRRLPDNAPDALVNIISNQQFVGPNAVGNPGLNIGNVVNGVPDVDLVPANDDLFRDTFPFLAIPNQPQFPGADANGNTIIHVPFVTPTGVPGVDPGAPDDRTRN